ncbi:MAG: carboxypeptidase-like regulatory domain-containing protein [Cyclobacteriaceae bacterium]|nr:carboxypeptidase-like regulatory domain-containing protein [Cyclobacteriaceae bacterium]MCH8514855.1 carboxypeptidase-like regulatory domain-containing protein [Cyclobacteriaceae bacterium]
MRLSLLFVISLIYFIGILGFETHAQNSSWIREIRGQIFNEDDSEPIPRVSIQIKNSPKGTATDNDGFFSLYIKQTDELIFTHVEYDTLRMVVKDSTVQGLRDIKLKLRPKTVQLREVIVLGKRDWSKFFEKERVYPDDMRPEDTSIRLKEPLEKRTGPQIGFGGATGPVGPSPSGAVMYGGLEALSDLISGRARATAKLQERLEEERREEELNFRKQSAVNRYKNLVDYITGLDEKHRDLFLANHIPAYYQIEEMSDYQLARQINYHLPRFKKEHLPQQQSLDELLQRARFR